jgi:hypothetical protein
MHESFLGKERLMTLERTRPLSYSNGPSDFSDDSDTATAVADGSVEVIHGVYAHSLSLAGMTVGQARAELEVRMNIDPDATAVVDGHQVPEDTILREGSVLNFVKHAGEKGR